MVESLVVETVGGFVKGVLDDSIPAFFGIPFAAPPIGPLRWAAPAPPLPWAGVRAAASPGPIAPQLATRLDSVYGGVGAAPQSEDCLTLNLWTPAIDRARRPVLVFIHGGGFEAGAGSLAGYSGHELVRSGDIVVVTFNYRLGVLGWAYLPELAPETPSNVGLLDQIAALQWVRDNIAQFGGDAGNVTVAGQSAGATSIMLQLSREEAPLFRRAIVHSCPFGAELRTIEAAGRSVRELADSLGVGVDRLREVAAESLVAAAGKVRMPGTVMDGLVRPFSPVRDGILLDRELGDPMSATRSARVDLLLGTAREEVSAFVALSPVAQRVDERFARQLLRMMHGDAGQTLYSTYAAQRPGCLPIDVIQDVLTDRYFRMGTIRHAELRAKAGSPAFLFQFDWQSPALGGVLRACHCLDLPFAFGNPRRWSSAPMMQDANPPFVEALAKVVSGAWTAFSRAGDPNHDTIPHWAPYRLPGRSTMLFDVQVRATRDPTAGLRSLWAPSQPVAAAPNAETVRLQVR